jgi:EAL domain-containing protein (putative c-di-GMP-specific phosphodiesterase class I)
MSNVLEANGQTTAKPLATDKRSKRDDLGTASSGSAGHRRLVKSLRLRYQPIIRLTDMQTDSLEVLARAETTDGALNGPETIVEAMTGAKASMALTGAILQRALAEFNESGLANPGPVLAINLPLDAMLHPDLVVIIETIRSRHRLAPQKIRFELTERHPVQDISAVGGIITVLRKAGYMLALDDITPGMPNLAALMKLPIHAIKLDRSIVVSGTRADTAFIRELVAHAQAHDHEIIAEGIETEATLKRMRRLGVTHGQGYLFAHPLPAAALKAFLNQPAR